MNYKKANTVSNYLFIFSMAFFLQLCYDIVDIMFVISNKVVFGGNYGNEQ